jgi:hypothetical protein
MEGRDFTRIRSIEGDNPVPPYSPYTCRDSNQTLPEYIYKSEAYCLCHIIRFVL